MYKLIAIDMDGTLLQPDHTISQATKTAILQAQSKGIKIVLASGRPLEGLTRYLEELNMLSEQDYVLGFNGSIVQNTKTKAIIRKNILKGKDLKQLYDISQTLGVNIHAFSTEGCITPKMNKYSELEGSINGIPIITMDYSQIDEQEDIIKIMMIDEPEILDEAIKKLPQDLYNQYKIVKSAPFFLEFLNTNADKAEGVKALAEHLGIYQNEIICIGDAENDLDMIKFAGLGVAMGNAFDEVKQVADYITKTNREDGVAYAIRKFVLQDVV